MNDELEAAIVAEIAITLAGFWYDKDQPFNHQREAYALVCKITRDLMGHTAETYERAILERDATVVVCKHFKI